MSKSREFCQEGINKWCGLTHKSSENKEINIRLKHQVRSPFIVV